MAILEAHQPTPPFLPHKRTPGGLLQRPSASDPRHNLKQGHRTGRVIRYSHSFAKPFRTLSDSLNFIQLQGIPKAQTQHKPNCLTALHQAAPHARGHVVPQIWFEQQLLSGSSVEAQDVFSRLMEADHGGLKLGKAMKATHL